MSLGDHPINRLRIVKQIQMFEFFYGVINYFSPNFITLLVIII